MYTTTLTDAQWQGIKNFIPQNERKRKYHLRAIWDAILYWNKTGCQWRMLPKEFPKWKMVYYYFTKWVKMGVIEDILHRINEIVRIKSGKQAQPSMVIIDCQCVKTTSVGGIRGFDGNKKITGRKRHVIVDTMGNVLSVVVHAAHLHDTAMAELVVRQFREVFFKAKKIVADGGYRGKPIEALKYKHNIDMEIVMRTDINKAFKILPRRWVVERTFAWFNGYRRLSKDYEFLTENSEAAIHLAAIKINLNKF
jgi:putative transposase